MNKSSGWRCGAIGVGLALGAWGWASAPRPVLAQAPPPATQEGKPGEVVEKYDDGAVRARYRTDAKGLKNGAYEELFPTGRAKVRGTYTAGQKSGAWTTFDEAGKTIESASYRADVLDGSYAWTGPSGKAGYRATYRAGEITGAVTVLDDKGRSARLIAFPRPLADVRQAWATLYPKEVGKPKFLQEPSAAAPYKAGKVAPESLQEALKVAKLYRYLSGVPWQHLALDPRDTEEAQHGAVLLQKLGQLTHTPGKPDDMDDAFFKLAYDGCNQSNLHQGQADIVAGLRGFMDDSDPSNIDRMGHRRWVLKPGLKKVGFGFAGGFTAMHVVDGSRDVPNFDFVAFPGQGYYPLQLVEKHYAWSVHFHHAKVQELNVGDLRVTVARLDERFQPAAGEPPAEAKVVSAINDKGQGWNLVVFKPELNKVEAGRYWVEITGLRTPRGAAAPPFGYIVEFVDMKPAADAK
jgi:hypothetical protein